MAEVTNRRAGEMLRGVLEILMAAPQGLPGREVIDKLETLVPPTTFENESFPNSPNGRRYPTLVRFQTIGAVKAQWLTKTKSTWAITDAGGAAYEAHPDPEDLGRQSAKAYADWKKAQTPAAQGSKALPLGPRSWLFQANPSLYDIAGAVAALPRLTWFVKHYASEMEVGDTVFIWQTGPSGGFIGVGHLSAEPDQMTLLPGEARFAVKPDVFDGLSTRAVVALDYRLATPFSRATAKATPGLDDLPHFKFGQGSNFKLTPTQAATLAAALSEDLVPVVAHDPAPDAATPPDGWRADLFDAAVAADREASGVAAMVHRVACQPRSPG